MGDSYSFYVAAGRSLAAILSFVELRKQLHKKHKAFADRFGAKSWSVNASAGIALLGLHFDTPPEGWKKMTRGRVTYDFYIPIAKAKGGKQLREEIQSLRIYVPHDVGYDYLGDGDHGVCLYHPVFEELGGKWVIRQHEKATPPPDAKPLKKSAYWKLKERNTK